MVPFLMHILLIRGTQAEVTEDLPISTEVLFQVLLRRHAPGTWVNARWSQRQTPSDSDSKQVGCKGRQGKGRQAARTICGDQKPEPHQPRGQLRRPLARSRSQTSPKTPRTAGHQRTLQGPLLPPACQLRMLKGWLTAAGSGFNSAGAAGITPCQKSVSWAWTAGSDVEWVCRRLTGSLAGRGSTSTRTWAGQARNVARQGLSPRVFAPLEDLAAEPAASDCAHVPETLLQAIHVAIWALFALQQAAWQRQRRSRCY